MIRRRFVLAAAAALPLAGCGADEKPSDDSETTETGTPTDDPSGGRTDTATDDESGESAETTEESGPKLSDVVRFEPSYAMEITLDDREQVIAVRYHDGDTYTRTEADGRTVESHSVDGNTYTVFPDEGRCLENAGDDQVPSGDSQVDPERYESDAEADPEITAAGRTTLDGEETYVFALPTEGSNDYDEDVTYYVSVETGYLRRIEFAEGVVDYHSWGEVDPVEPPEMECQSY